MPDYDLNKVSPRPWKLVRQGNFDEIQDVNGDTVQDSMPDSDDSKYILHRVNHHDPLVETLHDLIKSSCDLCSAHQGDWRTCDLVDECSWGKASRVVAAAKPE